MCAGLLYRDGCILLCRRAATRVVYPNVWDLPGGHCEPGESPDQTLERELQEEIGVTPVRARLLAEYQIADAGAGTAWLLVYLVTKWRGQPKNRSREEHDALAWFSVDQASTLDLASPLYPDLFRRAERQAG
jgi:mutator protein MutT